MQELFERAGFRVELYEYFDEAGTFHYREWDERAGKIWRSKRFDKRNTNGRLAFTSIILDAIEPLDGPALAALGPEGPWGHETPPA